MIEIGNEKDPIKAPKGIFEKEDEKADQSTFLAGAAFSVRKVTDTPTDALSVVNRRYVNMSGTLASRPVPATMGQRYYATNLGSGTLIVFNGNSSVWTNGAGSIIAS